METKEPTNNVEQEIENPQDTATTNEVSKPIEAKEEVTEVEEANTTPATTEAEESTTENIEVEATEEAKEKTPITENQSKEAELLNEVDTEEEVDYSDYSLEKLVEALIELVKVEDISSVKTRVGNIKAQYIKKIKQLKQDHYDKFMADGGVEEDYESIQFDFETQYQASLSLYKEKRSKYIQELEKEKEANYKKKEELLETLRNMINSDENLNKIYNEFRELQAQWREIGLVPQNQVKNLWENYHFLVEKFFEKVKINKDLMMLGLSKNLEEKIQLCEKTEELLLEKSINKSFKLLQEYHVKWKEVGPVPQEKNEEIWERFKNATDKVNKRRHDYYEKLNEEQQNNLLLKTALCEKAEAIAEQKAEGIKEWNKITDEINALFTEWKTLGPAPKKHNDAIWKRFKTALNNFFNNKKTYFNEIKEVQMNNYHLKVDIVAQAEAIQDSTEWKATTQELVSLQKKWKDIGPVPKKYSDKIWKKFRAACDYFFNAKDEFFKNIDGVEKENKAKKLELIEKIQNHEFGDNQEENLKTIKDYQRQWIEIGRVPLKDKNKIQTTFNKAIDKVLSNLNIDSFEFHNAGLKSKLDKMDNKSDGERLLNKEISFIRGKIDTLQKDINLWDNNISFFGSSKNADLLKADFEKKIAKAKKEVDVLKAKIRQLDKMKRNLKDAE